MLMSIWTRSIIVVALATTMMLSTINASADPLPTADIAAVKRAVGERLKDPYSAVYSGLERVPRFDGLRWACGWVNAKNSYGGYIGKRRFAVLEYLSKEPFVLIAKDETDDIESFCQPMTRQRMAAQKKEEEARKAAETAALQALAAEEAKEAELERGAACTPATFTLTASGPCGTLYAQCSREFLYVTYAEHERLMTVCRRSGFEAAKAMREQELKKSGEDTKTKWPAPVFPKN